MAENYNPHPQGYRPEWYTPKHIIEFAEHVFGNHADLDPASCASANNIIQARRYFTEQDDGLRQIWMTDQRNPTVWCNPPYGRGNTVYKWWRKMKAEFDAGHFNAGIFLANSKTETRWFQEALDTCPVLLIRGRLSFWRAEDAPTQTGHFGTALVLLSRPDGTPGSYNGSPTPYNAADLAGGDPALARFIERGRSLGQVVIAV